VPNLDWEELEPSAQHAFNIWMSGSDLEWAKQTWNLFTKAGFCNYDSPKERLLVIGRYLALASLYRDWCSVARDETQEDVPFYWIEELEIAPIHLGQLTDEELSEDADEAFSEALDILLELTTSRSDQRPSSGTHYSRTISGALAKQ
jgi:hypothetical protein